jgi:quercetin dioxygenase-like cupin family protein
MSGYDFRKGQPRFISVGRDDGDMERPPYGQERSTVLRVATLLIALAPIGAAAAQEGSNAMEIIRKGTQPSVEGPAEWFTGDARIDSQFKGSHPLRLTGATVTFEPGARTAWHTHPLGQTLILTAGAGWAQSEGEPRVEIRAGDVVWFPPGQKHWHGATATTGMTHIAIQEALDGKNVEWMEKVADEEYLGDGGDE